MKQTSMYLFDDDDSLILRLLQRADRWKGLALHGGLTDKEAERLERRWHHIQQDWFAPEQLDDAIRFVRAMCWGVAYSRREVADADATMRHQAAEQRRVLLERNDEATEELERV